MSYSEEARTVLNVLGDRPVGYHPGLARVLGGVRQAIFVSQLLYWHKKGARPDGFIWKTQAQFQEETGLTRRGQETARKHLRALGVLEEMKAGVPGRLHYRLDMNRLVELIIGEAVQPSMAGSAMLECPNPPCKDGGIVHVTESTIPESTIPESTVAPTAQMPTALSEKESKDQDQREEQRPSKMTTRKQQKTATVRFGASRTYADGELVIYPESRRDIPEVEVAEIWLEPEDTQLTCPLCDHAQSWPQSENMRRRSSSLICQVGESGPMDGCGAYLIVHAYKKSGRKFTYQLAIPKPQWVVVLRGIKWYTNEDEARLFLSNWDEDDLFLLEKFAWATAPETGMIRIWKEDGVLIQRVNAAYTTGMKNRAGRQAERDRPPEATEVLVDPETGQRYVEEGRY